MNNEYQEIYSFLYHNHWWWRAREIILDEVVSKESHKLQIENTRILDIGCSEGLSFNFLSKYGFVVGLDPSLQEDKKLNLPNNTQIIKSTLEMVELPKNSFDFITMFDVLEHLDDDRTSLCKAITFLKPGGKIIVTVPAFMMLWTYHDDLNEHRRRYSKEKLMSLFSSQQLEIERVKYLFLWTVPVKLAFKIAEKVSLYLGFKWNFKSHSVPLDPLNKLLIYLSLCEHKLSGKFNLNLFGSSILLIASKKE